MNVLRELYRAEKLPVFQNRMFQTREEAIHCVKGDIVLVQEMETGLIFNQAFNPKLMQYDAEYQNEQSYSSVFRRHLSEVSEITKKHFYEMLKPLKITNRRHQITMIKNRTAVTVYDHRSLHLHRH